MGSFLLYQRIPAETLRKQAKESIAEFTPKIAKFFEDRPERNDCIVQLWYGKHLTLKRGDDVATEINNLAESLIAEDAIKDGDKKAEKPTKPKTVKKTAKKTAKTQRNKK